ncbi:hypothetical protein [Methylobacterium komagatae]
MAAPAPPIVVRAAVPAAPSVVRAQTPGIQGPPGPAAPIYAKRFGTIDYTDNQQGSAFVLPPGQWMPLRRNLSPSAANFNLPTGPWAGFSFWDNATNTLRARAVGDVLLIKFSYIVVPAQRGGGLRFSVRPNDNAAFEFGPDPIALTADAGEMQPGSETFSEQCRTRFVLNGANIYLMATSGATLLEFSPEVTPLDFATP